MARTRAAATRLGYTGAFHGYNPSDGLLLRAVVQAHAAPSPDEHRSLGVAWDDGNTHVKRTGKEE